MFCHCVRNWQTLEILAGLLWFSPVCANDNEPFAISLLPSAARMVNEACISLVTVVAICPLGHLSFWPEVTSHCQWQWIRTGSLSDRKNLHRLVCLLHNVPSECRFATPEVRKVITYLSLSIQLGRLHTGTTHLTRRNQLFHEERKGEHESRSAWPLSSGQGVDRHAWETLKRDTQMQSKKRNAGSFPFTRLAKIYF